MNGSSGRERADDLKNPPANVEQATDGATPPGDWSYAGRWALVTGASAGIGELFAHALARRGMHVVVTARREDRLIRLAEALRDAYGVEAAVVAADLAAPGGAEAVWAAACAGREIHLLVNNAGFGLKDRFAEISVARQVEMVQLNCIALMQLTHLALGAMQPRGSGGIVNVASVAAFQPIPQLATYAASKAFVLSLSEAIRWEARESGVRIVTLCPGPVATEFQEVAGTSVGRKTPGLLPADEVVEAALRKLEAGGGTIVPGTVNRAGTVVARLFPRSWVLPTARWVIEKLR